MLFSLVDADYYYRRSGYNYDEDQKSNSVVIPNIYFGKIDDDLAVLVHAPNSRKYGSSYYNGYYRQDEHDWTNVNLQDKKTFWRMGSNECKKESYSWPTTSLKLIGPSPIPTIPKDLFNDLHVKKFRMNELNLTSISPKDFKNGYFLEAINLSNNTIAVVPSFICAYTPNINDVDLSNNEIEHIADDAFERDPSVDPFEDFISYCRVQYKDLLLTKDHTFLNIAGLFLNNNRLTVVNPKWFKSLKGLRAVSLAFNRIHKIDASAVFAENLLLSVVGLGNNAITDFTKLQFKAPLEEISLSNNPVETPSNLYANSSRTFMWNMRHVETRITISSQVFILDAGNNSITSVIAEHPSANALELLKLDNNKLTSISSLVAFHRLESLFLAKNLLTSFDSSVFEQMPGLRVLDLSYNQLKHFEMNIVMPSLQELHISGNGLTTIDTNLKNMAPDLVVVGLRDNNWNCEYLTTAMLLIHSDGIRPVVNGSTDTPDSYKQIKYDSSVKGVKCFNTVVTTTSGPTNGLEVAAVPESRELKDEVQQLLSDKLSTLQDKLIGMLQKIGKDQSNVINDKFNQLNMAMNRIA